MSEFEESTYQSATETIESNETPIEQTQVEETPATTQEQQDYFTVKYNKEERQVSYDEAPDYIQKGMNYDKVSQRAEEYQQQAELYQQDLDRVARIAGYQSHDAMRAELDQIEREQERQDLMQRGLDPDALEEVVNKRIEQHPDMQSFRQLQQQQQETQQLQTEANELFSEFPGLTAEQIPAEAWQLKDTFEKQGKNISLLDAYLRTTYKSLGQQKEQEAIQKLQNNAVASPGSLGGGDVNHNTNISNLSSKDFNSMVDQVLRGERKQL